MRRRFSRRRRGSAGRRRSSYKSRGRKRARPLRIGYRF